MNQNYRRKTEKVYHGLRGLIPVCVKSTAYVTQQFNRYVMGVESLDTFDQFYRQLKEMGIETVLENHQEAYDLMYQK